MVLGRVQQPLARTRRISCQYRWSFTRSKPERWHTLTEKISKSITWSISQNPRKEPLHAFASSFRELVMIHRNIDQSLLSLKQVARALVIDLKKKQLTNRKPNRIGTNSTAWRKKLNRHVKYNAPPNRATRPATWAVKKALALLIDLPLWCFPTKYPSIAPPATAICTYPIHWVWLSLGANSSTHTGT